MRHVAICGSKLKELSPDNKSIETITLHGVPLTCGVIHTKDPEFDKQATENRFKVLVRIRGFSCNYRDQTLIFAAARRNAGNSFWSIGSDFVGEVLEVGRDVTTLQAGDRVVGDNHYFEPHLHTGRAPQGVPTNNASREYQAFDETKLIKIPENMPDADAAGFSIGAQTTYGMIQKINLTPPADVLVLAAKSNTSLFVINALRKYGVNVYATSTSLRFEKELRAMGVREVFQVDPAQPTFEHNERLREMARQIGNFNFVFDPFYDLHFGKVVPAMRPHGKYVTCGLGEQYQSVIGQEFKEAGGDWKKALMSVMINNLQVIGNCLGRTEDLRQALEDYASGLFQVTVDSVFRGKEVGAFLNRTYNSPERFGKVVYLYD